MGCDCDKGSIDEAEEAHNLEEEIKANQLKNKGVTLSLDEDDMNTTFGKNKLRSRKSKPNEIYEEDEDNNIETAPVINGKKTSLESETPKLSKSVKLGFGLNDITDKDILDFRDCCIEIHNRIRNQHEADQIIEICRKS